MDLEAFHHLAESRRATRHFKPDPLPDGLLHRLLDTTRWAPSGYNLQPTHFVVVTDPALKPALQAASMDQKQITEAPATVVFLGDRRVAQNNLYKILKHEREAGSIDDQYERTVRSYVSLAFGQGPLGFGWLWKATLAPLLGLVRPVPSIPTVHKRYWLAKQTMLSAMVFMLAAQSAGLATCPMEGFDERRVRRALGIPADFVVCLVVPVGYGADDNLTKTRLPLNESLHTNGW